MISLPRTVASLVLGSFAFLFHTGTAAAQYAVDGWDTRTTAARADWQQRAVAGSRAQPATAMVAAPGQAELTDYRYSPPAYQQAPANRVAMTPRFGGYRRTAMVPGGPSAPPGAEVIPPGPQVVDPPTAEGSAVFTGTPQPADPPVFGDPGASMMGSCTGGSACGSCGPCCETCDQCDDCFCVCLGGVLHWLLQDSCVFAGITAFKGPFDTGRNGNFGFAEGINMGAPIGGPWPIGFQLGFEATQSDFASDEQIAAVGPGRSNRQQLFFTAGLFQRAPCGGLQWGMAFDLLRDSYFDSANLRQIRSESSWMFADGRNEIGYAGTYDVGGDRVTNAFFFGNADIRPTDMYAGFYRRHFETGGEGKVSVGATGRGQVVLGGELRVPLGKSWALENRIGYIIPNRSIANTGQFEEAWGLGMNLVWYPGRRAVCAGQSCYRPLLSVADNATFMSRLAR
jgi:hypothetical protein